MWGVVALVFVTAGSAPSQGQPKPQGDAGLFKILPAGADVTAACAKAEGRSCDPSELMILTAVQTRQRCLEALYRNPDFKSITGHFPLDEARPSAAQLADKSKPAGAQLMSVKTYMFAEDQCRTSLVSAVRLKSLNLATVISRQSEAKLSRWSGLYSASWGTFNDANKRAVRSIESLLAEAAQAPEGAIPPLVYQTDERVRAAQEAIVQRAQSEQQEKAADARRRAEGEVELRKTQQAAADYQANEAAKAEQQKKADEQRKNAQEAYDREQRRPRAFTCREYGSNAVRCEPDPAPGMFFAP